MTVFLVAHTPLSSIFSPCLVQIVVVNPHAKFHDIRLTGARDIAKDVVASGRPTLGNSSVGEALCTVRRPASVSKNVRNGKTVAVAAGETCDVEGLNNQGECPYTSRATSGRLTDMRR